MREEKRVEERRREERRGDERRNERKGWREGVERRRERGRMKGVSFAQCQAISQVEHSHKERKGCWFSGGSSCDYCGINSTCLI